MAISQLRFVDKPSGGFKNSQWLVHNTKEEAKNKPNIYLVPP